ncbi:MAG: hypothetical protein HFG28_16235 [Eubacterium sp.]|nr:hypothetical protein [Eubacterium sp.]
MFDLEKYNDFISKINDDINNNLPEASNKLLELKTDYFEVINLIKSKDEEIEKLKKQISDLQIINSNLFSKIGTSSNDEDDEDDKDDEDDDKPLEYDELFDEKGELK